MDGEEEDVMFMAFIEDDHEKKTWFLDSGCRNHMCGNKKWFSTLDDGFCHFLKVGNNSQLRVMGKGDVSLRFEGGNHTVIDVYLVPDLRSNLLSIG